MNKRDSALGSTQPKATNKLDKLEVTGSSPVTPIAKSGAKTGVHPRFHEHLANDGESS